MAEQERWRVEYEGGLWWIAGPNDEPLICFTAGSVKGDANEKLEAVLNQLEADLAAERTKTAALEAFAHDAMHVIAGGSAHSPREMHRRYANLTGEVNQEAAPDG